MIKNIEVKGNLVKFTASRDLENALLALKVFLNQERDVEVAGISSEHYLVDEVSFVVKVKKGEPLEVVKRVIDVAIEGLNKMKLK